MVDWGPIIQAGIGAAGAAASARQANKPRSSHTNQTTTQGPYAEGLIQPDIMAALDLQRQLMQRGPAQIGRGGVSYGWDSGSGGAAAGGGGGGSASNRNPNRPTTWTNARGETMTMGAGGRPVRASAPVPAGGAAGGPAGPSTPHHSVDEWSDIIAQRGLDAGNDPTTQAAGLGVRNILSGQGGAGSGTGFQGYNPILDALSQHDLANLDDETATALLREFAGADNGGGGGAGGASGAGGGSAGTGGGGPGVPLTYARSQGWFGHPPNGGGQGGNNQVPDTVGGNSSYFATQVRQLMDQGANDADIQRVIDAANADTTRAMQQDLWGLDASAQGTGRYGGDMWAGMAAGTRSDAARRMADQASQTRLNELANRRAMQQGLLSQVNTRDLGAMSDATQRYGIDSSASAAGAGSAAAAELARRGQNLQALLALQQGEQVGANRLAGVGGQLSSDQLSAINQSQGLANIGLSGLNQSNSAINNLVANRGVDAQLRAAQMSANAARAGLNQQANIFNAQQGQNQIDSYFNMLRGIGGMGGYSHTEGENVQPGMGVNPYIAAAMGGYAGYTGGR